jgi:hypothetical protein
MATRRAARPILAALAAVLAVGFFAARGASAQPLPPRLVVFEGFYNPG